LTDRLNDIDNQKTLLFLTKRARSPDALFLLLQQRLRQAENKVDRRLGVDP
jgi:hypothetical protein